VVDTRLVIVEGIIGSGKSTLSRFLARQIARAGRPAQLYVAEFFRHDSPERNRPGFISFAELLAGTNRQENPTDAARPLRDRCDSWRAFWDTATPGGIAERAESNWHGFVQEAGGSDTVNVFDGQFFNGDVTALMLLDEPHARLEAFQDSIVRTAAPLRPVLIYLRPADVSATLTRAGEVRGQSWVQAQSGKLEAPYCRRRGLTGIDGWIALYEAYRRTTDQLFETAAVPKVRIDVSPDGWREGEAKALAFLSLARRFDLGFEVWRHTRRAIEQVGART
jgi:hypothetical protein